ncbi:MAG: hypothetical protein HYY37_00850 [Candidatus Aenigmarchaeota archaeon]|nr:hypothetical protein [Candidatus Aenigmarchaeota archaeon]
MKRNNRAMTFVLHGALASAALFMVYFLIVSVAQGTSHAFSQFASLWYFMTPLIIGFGFQMALFSYIHNMTAVSAKSVAAAGGVSTVSMVACCAHHVTDVLPLMGLTAVTLFLGKYQAFFIVLGIVSSVIGTLFMLSLIQEKRLYNAKTPFRSLFRHNITEIRNFALVAAVPVLIVAFLLIK